jgi:starch-binding outer membrane protein, SusD/RagB family
MKKIKNILFFLTAVIIFSSSCKKLLEVNPRQSVDSQTALTSEKSLFAALGGCYDRMQSIRYYGSDMLAISEALSDNGRGRTGTGTNSGRLAGQLQHLPGSHLAIWNSCYLIINQVNLILEATPKVQMTDATRKVIEGEAYFFRALAYHDLARTYSYDPGAVLSALDRGCVPIVKKGVIDAAQLVFPVRDSRENVYALIYADLQESITRLDNNPVARTVPFFVSATAAKALFSRVALYNRDYANAVTYATDAINGAISISRPLVNSPTGSQNYFNAWRSSSHPESLFELVFVTSENPGVNESLQTLFTSTVNNSSSTGGFGDLLPQTLASVADATSLTTLLASSTRGGALLRLGSAGRGNQSLSEYTKFYGRGGQINLDNVPLIRTAEVYLNLAEAQALNNAEAAALITLNTVQTNRGTTLSVGLTGQALVNAILLERRAELAFEGHRFFDLKRRSLNTTTGGGASFDFTNPLFLAPIPQADINANVNLIQNVGY